MNNIMEAIGSFVKRSRPGTSYDNPIVLHDNTPVPSAAARPAPAAIEQQHHKRRNSSSNENVAKKAKTTKTAIETKQVSIKFPVPCKSCSASIEGLDQLKTCVTCKQHCHEICIVDKICSYCYDDLRNTSLPQIDYA
jgi:hypothetical protein